MDFRLNSEEFQNHVPSKMTPLQKVFCPFVSHLILLQYLDFAIPSFICWPVVCL